MAVFFDTGGGDIYAGPTKEAVIAAMQEDSGEINLEEVFEVSGTMKMQAENETGEPEEELTTLDEEYDESIGAYCIASENC